MANPSASVSASAAQPTIHDTDVLPAWWVRLQRNVFMAAFVLASGFIIAQFLTTGLGTGSGGQNRVLAVGAFFATAVVGGLCGGMTVLCSVSTKALWDRGRRLLSLFAFLLMWLFALVEFYAGLVDRIGNVPVNAVDTMILSWFGLRRVPITPTMLVIAASVSLIGIAWGFAQYQPPQMALEDAEDEHTRQMQAARHRIELNALRAGGARQVAGAALGRSGAASVSTVASTIPDATHPAYAAAYEVAPLAPPWTGDLPNAVGPAGNTPAILSPDGAPSAYMPSGNIFARALAPLPAASRPLPGSDHYPDFVASRWAALASARAGSGVALSLGDLVAAVGDSEQQVRDGIRALRRQEMDAVPAGRQTRRSRYSGLYDLAS